MKIAGFEFDDLTTMPGLCTSIFTQGCMIRCKGCFNERTWDPEDGVYYTPEELVKRVTDHQIAHRIAWLGGEPLLQPSGELLTCVTLIHEKGYTQMLYTGYTFKQLMEKAEHDPNINKILNYMKWVKTGPWIAALASPKLKARGSSNQQIYEVVLPSDESGQREFVNVTDQWDATAMGVRHVQV